MKLIIKKSPVGALKLAYSIGEVVEVKDEGQAKALLDGKFAVPYEQIQKAAQAGPEGDVPGPEGDVPGPEGGTSKRNKRK